MESRRATGHLSIWPTAGTLWWAGFWLVLVVVLLVPTACFLVLSVSPRLFDQGTSWLTLRSFREALQGTTLRGMFDSLAVGVVASLAATSLGAGLAWVLQRTTLPLRRLWSLGIWAVLLVPSYIIAVGWQVILGPGGILASLHAHSTALEHLFFGPTGYAAVLAIKGVPFTYFAIAGPLAGLGRSYEDAARTHGAGRLGAIRLVGRILLPALFAAAIIVFAEAISDFGTAAVIAPDAHFPVATYTLYTSLSTYPANFGVAAVIGLMLVLAVATALFVQARFTRRRSYAVLGARTRRAAPNDLSTRATVVVAVFISGFFSVALLVPILGAIAASLLTPFSTFGLTHLTLGAYRGIFSSGAFASAIALSMKMAVINASLALVIGAVIARRLAGRQTDVVGQVLNVTLLAAIALPGIVLAAGYIFAYNLPWLGAVGVHLYGTLTLLGMAYLAGSLPSTSRLLLGPMTQLQANLVSAARVHGGSAAGSWLTSALPLIATSLMWAWLFSFALTFLELPVSELLAPPGSTPVSLAIIQVLHDSDIFRATALSIVALLIDLGVISLLLVGFALAAPKGWKRVGARGL